MKFFTNPFKKKPTEAELHAQFHAEAAKMLATLPPAVEKCHVCSDTIAPTEVPGRGTWNNRFWGRTWGRLTEENTGADSTYRFFTKRNLSDSRIVIKTDKDDKTWSPIYRGVEVIRLMDDGNGASIKLDDKDLGYLNYGQLYHLALVMREYMGMPGNSYPARKITKKKKGAKR